MHSNRMQLQKMTFFDDFIPDLVTCVRINDRLAAVLGGASNTVAIPRTSPDAERPTVYQFLIDKNDSGLYYSASQGRNTDC
jgi:hypothetical protein